MTQPTAGYAVFLHDQAIEVLGEALKPYLQEGVAGIHVACHGIDTAGAFVEMTILARSDTGETAEIELMIPSGMVRMIVSMHSDTAFGFAASRDEPTLRLLPVRGPDAPPPSEPSAATPGVAESDDDRRLPPEG